jgi:hypothetical protein
MWTVREPERKIDPLTVDAVTVSAVFICTEAPRVRYSLKVRECVKAVPVPVPVRMPSGLYFEGCCGCLCETAISQPRS